MKTKIYTLVDPTTDQVRYVGITEGSLQYRLNGHIKESIARKEFHPNRKHIWINNLLAIDKRPEIILIDEVTSSPEWWEVWWMDYLTSLGMDLLNICKIQGYAMVGPRTEMFQFDLDGNFLHSYYSVTTAAGKVSGNDAIIHRAARMGNGYKAYGFQWRYQKSINIGPARSKKQPNMDTKVNQFNIDGTFIKEWDSGQLAATTLGLLKSKISNCCNGKRKTHGGFTWSFA